MRVIKFLLWIVVVALALVAILFLVIKFTGPKRTGAMIYGISFNSEYASYLGLNPRQVYEKILGEWGFTHIRLSAQWNLIEKTKGQYDWKELDWMMSEAAKKNAKVILTVGHKTPRWPECHFPDWVDISNHQAHKEDFFDFFKVVVGRYKNHPALEIWQIENEPFLGFGECAHLSKELLVEEVAQAKLWDPNHPTMVTDSGELSLWRHTAKQADFFGTTLYRVVWSKMLGYWSYDWILPSFVYRAKLWFNGRDPNTAFVAELQAEPWIPDANLVETPLAEQFKSMSLERLKKNIAFADKTGMARAYLWGAEWWYWLESHGAPEFSEYIKQLKKE